MITVIGHFEIGDLFSDLMSQGWKAATRADRTAVKMQPPGEKEIFLACRAPVLHLGTIERIAMALTALRGKDVQFWINVLDLVGTGVIHAIEAAGDDLSVLTVACEPARQLWVVRWTTSTGKDNQ
jgi:hypothetical protein